MFPPFFSQRRGEAQSRGEREIRNELSFQASGGSGKKKTSSESPESLASRIYRTLDGVPRSGKFEGEHPNAIGQALELALISKKNGRYLGGPQINKCNLSLSAHVLRRKPTRQPAQKKRSYLPIRTRYDLTNKIPQSSI